ncbi:MAG: hypothetical protein IPM76_23980 [Chloroflexi bacterium]|nr:hypothetical protein [Chloroflexota bacterium]
MSQSQSPHPPADPPAVIADSEAADAALQAADAALRAANVRLLALRAQVQAARESTPAAIAPPAAEPPTERPVDRDRLAGLVAALPTHLGWESTAVTAHLRQSSMANGQLLIVNEGEAATAGAMPAGKEPPATLPLLHSALPTPHSALPTPHSALRNPQSAIILLPALALAFLREERAAEGRLWLLLRHLDEAGQGWINKQTAVAHLTDPASPLRLYHERYLRLLLARGDGVFWQWVTGEDGRIWLYRPERVAAALGVERLDGRRVALPLADLLASLSVVKAHFYASFHSAQAGVGADGLSEDGPRASGAPSRPPGQPSWPPGQPISRAALAELSGVSRRTQQRYEAQAGVRRQANFALGAPLTEADAEEMAWQYGRGAFAFHDVIGRHGRPGAHYQARQLPNSYAGPHRSMGRRSSRRRYGRQGRRAVDLRRQGDAGNGRSEGKLSRRYYAGGTAVARALRQAGGARYWRGRCRCCGGWVWYPLPGQAL